MAYIFYFLGYVMMYQISKNLGDEDTPEWYHAVTAAIWPLIIVLTLVEKFKDTFIKGEE